MTPPPTPGSDAAPEPAGAPRIVTAVTGDDSGMSALRWVLTWLDPVPGALRLLVVENSDVRRSQVQDAVGAAVEQLGEHAAARASTAVWWTAAAPARAHAIGRAIVERLGPADLLVLGSDRSTRMEGLTDSSLPLYVVAIASSPVVVVPRTWDPATRIVLLVGDNDDADADDLPLRFAAAHAHRLGSPLELAHAWQVAPGYPAELAAESAGYAAAREDAASTLERRAGRARELFPELALTEHLVEGARVSALLPVLAGAGLAVIGRHGAGLLRDVVLGSLAHDLVAVLPCPLAVIPSGADPAGSR